MNKVQSFPVSRSIQLSSKRTRNPAIYDLKIGTELVTAASIVRRHWILFENDTNSAAVRHYAMPKLQ